MKAVIVTGASSFIGVHIVNEFLERGYMVYGVVRPNSANKYRMCEHENLKILEIEMKDINNIRLYVNGTIEAFIHLAWEGTRPPYRDDSQLQYNNYVAAVEAMKAAIALDAKCFIGSGSQAEYGKFNGEVDENYPCNPTTEYGKAKYKAYCTLSQMAENSDIRFIWTRIFSVYGKYDYAQTLVMSCLDKMSKNETLEMTECTQMWDYIYVDDAARVFVDFSQSDCMGGVYNIASGKPRRLRDYVEAIKSILKSNSQIEYGAIPYGKDGPVSFEPVVTKLEKALNWSAHTSFEEGIRLMLEDGTHEKDKRCNTNI